MVLDPPAEFYVVICAVKTTTHAQDEKKYCRGGVNNRKPLSYQISVLITVYICIYVYKSGHWIIRINMFLSFRFW